MLLMHGLSYGHALTRNTKERASVCQSDQVGLRPPRVTSHTILTRTIFSSMSFIPNCRAGYHQFLGSSSRTYTRSIFSIVSPIFLQSGTVCVPSCRLTYSNKCTVLIFFKNNGGLLPDIILLIQCYYHRGTRLNAMKRFCLCSL